MIKVGMGDVDMIDTYVQDIGLISIGGADWDMGDMADMAVSVQCIFFFLLCPSIKVISFLKPLFCSWQPNSATDG